MPVRPEGGVAKQLPSEPTLTPPGSPRWLTGLCTSKTSSNSRSRRNAVSQGRKSPSAGPTADLESHRSQQSGLLRIQIAVPLYGGKRFWTKSGRRATASESSPTQCLQYPKQQSSIIRSEEHCVPEAGMQWHILVWHIAFSWKHPQRRRVARHDRLRSHPDLSSINREKSTASERTPMQWHTIRRLNRDTVLRTLHPDTINACK